MGSFDRSMTVNQLDESLGGTGLEVSIRTQELDLFQVMYDVSLSSSARCMACSAPPPSST